MFTRLMLQGYRCLANVDLELRPLNVFLGANGSGKSSVLDLFDLLSRAAKGELSKAITERGGLHAALTALRDKHADKLALGLAWSDPGAHEGEPYSGSTSHDYGFTLGTLGVSYFVEREDLNRRTLGRRSPRVRIDNVALPRFKELEGPPPELALARAGALRPLRTVLDSAARFALLDTRARAPIKLPQELEPAQLLPGPDGETLVSALYNLKTDHPAVFERIGDTLRAGFPDFEGIDIPLVAAGRATFVSRRSGLMRSLWPHELSDGMLRFLWLTTLLLSPRLPPLVTLDEPEVSLHPQLLMLLAGLLREASLRSQLLVATHSPQLVRWLGPGDIVILDVEDGAASAKRADDPSLNIEGWLAEYTLGEAWEKGALGGRT